MTSGVGPMDGLKPARHVQPMRASVRPIGGVSARQLLLFIVGACSQESTPEPTPPNRLKTLGELSAEERQDLCDWSTYRATLDPDLVHALCTNVALWTSTQLDLDCSEQREICIRVRRGVADSTPCFLDADEAIACGETQVGEHLDCIEDFRQDVLDLVGGARCGDPSTYVPLEEVEAHGQGLAERGSGCRSLAESCPEFFRNRGITSPPASP